MPLLFLCGCIGQLADLKVVVQLYHVGCHCVLFSVHLIFSLAGAVKLINLGF